MRKHILFLLNKLGTYSFIDVKTIKQPILNDEKTTVQHIHLKMIGGGFSWNWRA
jgi:hypothetical protein